MKYCIVTPWHNDKQRDAFCKSWGIDSYGQDWHIFQYDARKQGCAHTKNKGIVEALHREAEVVMILDDDCYPYITPPEFPATVSYLENNPLERWAEAHLKALEPIDVELYEAVTDPPSRGTPYYDRSIKLPVAASMGFWTENADYDAPRTLVNNVAPTFHRKAMYWRWFPFSGMNCAFRREFWPHFSFDEQAPRMDDTFMGYKLQGEAYRKGHCINLQGPTVRHVRQSNVWNNLKVEAENLERNESEWKKYV